MSATTIQSFVEEGNEELSSKELTSKGMGFLVNLPIGGAAVVHSLSGDCKGAERRRLLDLGIVPGSQIRCEFSSPFGDPRSYRIRGALIALRNHQAEHICVHFTESP